MLSLEPFACAWRVGGRGYALRTHERFNLARSSRVFRDSRRPCKATLLLAQPLRRSTVRLATLRSATLISKWLLMVRAWHVGGGDVPRVRTTSSSCVSQEFDVTLQTRAALPAQPLTGTVVPLATLHSAILLQQMAADDARALQFGSLLLRLSQCRSISLCFSLVCREAKSDDVLTRGT